MPVPAAVLTAAEDYPEILPGDLLPEPQYDSTYKRWASMNGPSRSASMSSPRDGEGHAQDEVLKPLVSSQAFVFDQWVYKDPQVTSIPIFFH